MRDRKEIELDTENRTEYGRGKLILEVLLDIRDLLDRKIEVK